MHVMYLFVECIYYLGWGQFIIILALANKGRVKSGFLRGVGCTQRYIEMPSTPFSLVCARNILTVLREILTQYITFNRGGYRGASTPVLCSIATVTTCIDPSVRLERSPYQ
jgi:hypothetical protein